MRNLQLPCSARSLFSAKNGHKKIFPSLFLMENFVSLRSIAVHHGPQQGDGGELFTTDIRL